MITLHNKDCYEMLKEMESNSVDLVIIDPPYLMEVGGGGWRRNRPYLEHIEQWKDGIDNCVLDELIRVMKKTNIYIFASKNQIHQYLDYFENIKIKGRGRMNFDLLTWHKDNPMPICGNKYLSDTEYILFFRESGVKVHGNYHTKRKYIVTHTNRKDKEMYDHPTIKPQVITDMLIQNSSLEGQVVLDCYMGTGTTGASAIELGRDFIGCEIDTKHFITAEVRLKECEELCLK